MLFHEYSTYFVGYTRMKVSISFPYRERCEEYLIHVGRMLLYQFIAGIFSSIILLVYFIVKSVVIMLFINGDNGSNVISNGDYGDYAGFCVLLWPFMIPFYILSLCQMHSGDLVLRYIIPQALIFQLIMPKLQSIKWVAPIYALFVIYYTFGNDAIKSLHDKMNYTDFRVISVDIIILTVTFALHWIISIHLPNLINRWKYFVQRKS